MSNKVVTTEKVNARFFIYFSDMIAWIPLLGTWLLGYESIFLYLLAAVLGMMILIAVRWRYQKNSTDENNIGRM